MCQKEVRGAAERLAVLVACGPEDSSHTLAVDLSWRFRSSHLIVVPARSHLVSARLSCLPHTHICPFCTFQISLNSAFAIDF